MKAALEAMRGADGAAGRPRPFSEHLADLTAGPVEAPDAESRQEEELREHRDALLTLGREYLAVETGSTTLGGFVAWLDAGTRTDPTPEPGVDLVTFHRAKGLEWRVVFVTGLRTGTGPDRVGPDGSRDLGGAPPAPCRTEPSRRRSALFVGAGAHGRQSYRPPRTEPVASADRRAGGPRRTRAARHPNRARGHAGRPRRGDATATETSVPAPLTHRRARATMGPWPARRLPLFPTDDGWPYPDAPNGLDIVDDTEPDLDALELQADKHAFDTLTPAERDAVMWRFGLDGGTPLSLKDLGPKLGCTRTEARDLLGAGIDKLRTRLTSTT